ncbi:Ubiquinone biosynthesis O-methyltransferase [Tepidimonas alkaliphilus]|uniref:Ubiquinone biosynthesis O-methyltransferase n=1 Tax=Tepidimonas alkaliphilus TaxID=2588942 RepID=A0A554W3P2_9BURK|nr:class I SAM-dependent methyltransferase [Tepidimonas alkaliphilus]TSE18192.1 Ubiquinone biosynthesis O-methyltransferase [Tepidimonas alkaliphilus]
MDFRLKVVGLAERVKGLRYMNKSKSLVNVELHFAFGKNWAEYAEKVTEAEIAEAERGLQRLLAQDRLDGLSFLDIGCGSGIHSLAAIRLGARKVFAVDLDADSVHTTQALLKRHVPSGGWSVKEISVFDLDPDRHGAYEVVYSWGVLHHTGAMVDAIESAARMVAPGGRFVFALYRRVWMDFFWCWEKRWYSKASPAVQRIVQAIYIWFYRFALWVTGRNFKKYVENYSSNRGMDFYHDVHDWLGGYPYESILPQEVDLLMQKLGFSRERVFARQGRFFGRSTGLFGSGCDEYVYRKD